MSGRIPIFQQQKLEQALSPNTSNENTITWEGDTLSSDRQHNISFAHFKELEQYRTVRVTYWRHTGLVWSIEPLEKK